MSSSSNDGVSAASPSGHPLRCGNPTVVVMTPIASGGVKTKPRLTRQVAVQQEENSSGHTKSVSFNAPATNEEQQRPHFCPLHAPRLEGVWESSVEEDEDDDNDTADEEVGTRNRIGDLFQTVASLYNNRDKNRLGLSGFVPRKLSTISSRSCSINPEVEEELQQMPKSSLSSELLQKVMEDSPVNRTMKRCASKSDNDLYCHKRPNNEQQVGSLTRLPIARAAKTSTAKQAISGITSTSFEMIDDDTDDDDCYQQPRRSSLLEAKQEKQQDFSELGNDAILFKEEKDPLLNKR